MLIAATPREPAAARPARRRWRLVGKLGPDPRPGHGVALSLERPQGLLAQDAGTGPVAVPVLYVRVGRVGLAPKLVGVRLPGQANGFLGEAAGLVKQSLLEKSACPGHAPGDLGTKVVRGRRRLSQPGGRQGPVELAEPRPRAPEEGRRHREVRPLAHCLEIRHRCGQDLVRGRRIAGEQLDKSALDVALGRVRAEPQLATEPGVFVEMRSRPRERPFHRLEAGPGHQDGALDDRVAGGAVANAIAPLDPVGRRRRAEERGHRQQAEAARLLPLVAGGPRMRDGALELGLHAPDVPARAVDHGQPPPRLGQAELVAARREERDQPLHLALGGLGDAIRVGEEEEVQASQGRVRRLLGVAGGGRFLGGAREDGRGAGELALLGERRPERGEDPRTTRGTVGQQGRRPVQEPHGGGHVAARQRPPAGRTQVTPATHGGVEVRLIDRTELPTIAVRLLEVEPHDLFQLDHPLPDGPLEPPAVDEGGGWRGDPSRGPRRRRRG